MVVLAVLDLAVILDQQVLLEILVNRVHQDLQDHKDQREILVQKETLEILDLLANKVHLDLLVIWVCQVQLAVQDPKEQLVSNAEKCLSSDLVKFCSFLIVEAQNLSAGEIDGSWDNSVELILTHLV